MKKPLVILIGAVLLGGIGAVTYMLVSPKKVEPPKDILVNEEASKPKLLVWDDPAGFTFSYPDGLVVNKHDEDQQNYAHVEMTHPQHKGGLIVWAKDLPVGVIDAATWVKKDASLSAGVTLETTLGEVVAKKVLITAPEKRMYIGTVFDGTLFYIESTLADDVYWEAAVNTIAGSFTFKPTTEQTQSSQGAPASIDDTSVDEEEVLQ